MNDTHANVTVGLPFSDQSEQEFVLAVRSIYAQDFKNWKLHLVGDGATESLCALATRIKDPRVQVTLHAERKGLATRLNEISAASCTEYIARMDADDAMVPHRLRRQIDELSRDSSIDMHVSDAYIMDQAGKVAGIFSEGRPPQSRVGFFTRASIIHPSVMARRAWAVSHPYDETFGKAQDKELWVRSAASTSICYAPEPLLLYRVSREIVYSKHRLSSRADRRILRLHGPALIGKVRTASLITRSHLKQFAFGVSLLLKRSDALYRRKIRSGDSGALVGTLVIDQLLKTPVPGWENLLDSSSKYSI